MRFLRLILVLFVCYSIVATSSVERLNLSLYEHIAREARRHDFELWLVHRVIKEESGWRSRPGPTGDYGLMQLQLATAREIMRDQTITPAQLLNDDFLNTTAGIRYLAWCRKQWNGNIALALASYNRGIKRVMDDLKVGQSPLNGYVHRILISPPTMSSY